MYHIFNLVPSKEKLYAALHRKKPNSQSSVTSYYQGSLVVT